MKNETREIFIYGIKEINKLERFIEEICDYYNVNNEYFGNILMATTEATSILFTVTDMQEFGSVLIRFDKHSKGLTFKIRLESNYKGQGDSEDILDREIRKYKLSKEIFIVKALTDEITISLTGKSIILTFYISSLNYEKSLNRINQLRLYWKKSVSITQNQKKNG